MKKVLFGFFCLLCFFSAPSLPLPQFPSLQPGVVVSATPRHPLAQEIFSLVNTFRGKQGLKPLAWQPGLQALATAKAADLSSNPYFGHNSPTLGSPQAMLSQAGIFYLTGAENIAKTHNTTQNAAAIVGAWLQSPSHLKNILNPAFNQTGIGISLGKDGTIYCSQFFISTIPKFFTPR